MDDDQDGNRMAYMLPHSVERLNAQMFLAPQFLN
jgi:hypothetical protein